MHTVILGVGLCAIATATASAPVADCPARDAPSVERFVLADCVTCWQRADAAEGRAHWRLDWIVPAAADAALAAAALPEAAERALRAASAPGRRLAPPRGARLTVSAGPAWHGYIGVQVDASGPWPHGSHAFVALVEPLPANSDGNADARTLVRNVAGPLTLPGSHLHALRWPETAQVERLQPRAWVESADGRMLAQASPSCPLR